MKFDGIFIVSDRRSFQLWYWISFILTLLFLGQLLAGPRILGQLDYVLSIAAGIHGAVIYQVEKKRGLKTEIALLWAFLAVVIVFPIISLIYYFQTMMSGFDAAGNPVPRRKDERGRP